MSSRSTATTTTTSLWTAAAVAVSTTAVIWWYNNQAHQKKQQEEQKNNETDKNTTCNNTSQTTRGVMPLVVAQLDAPMSEIDIVSSNDAKDENKNNDNNKSRILTRGMISIVHGSVTGTCLNMARDLEKRLVAQVQQHQPQSGSGACRRKVQMGMAQDWDWWDELLNDDNYGDNDGNDEKKKNPTTTSSSSTGPIPVLILLLPTYTNGSWTSNSISLQEALQELQNDWRIAKFPLKNKLQIAVYGIGSSAYNDSSMGKPARQAVRLFQKLGAKCLVRLVIGDADIGNDAWETFQTWSDLVILKLQLSTSTPSLKPHQQQQQKQQQLPPQKGSSSPVPPPSSSCECKEQNGDNATATAAFVSKDSSSCCGNNSNQDGDDTKDTCCCGNNNNNNNNNNDQERDQEEYNHDNTNGNDKADDDGENEDYFSAPEDEDDYDDDYDDDDDDQGGGGEPAVMDLEDMGDAILASSSSNNNNNNKPLPEMVTPNQAKALKKEGYKLIGTHSAVKLCRWTKHQLRGRGGCYKHTFYGITSYQCMEATPSLACANKCVFCWRHHKNPVGKEWRWKTDDPHFIVQQAVETHVQMIKEAKGIPGVRMDRWKEAHTVRHCALSLVGEPIMYPRIDELLADLHERKISTFLVTNGQHPHAIGTLRPITQLYVSVDAPTKQSLIEIDRPLFQDAWERLKQSLVGLKDKGQRTVARLTVVKGWNSDEVEGYAALVALGKVSLVEVKGVTFCGKSDASNLNMSNTPWHHEVVALTQKLKEELDKIRIVDSRCPEYGMACEHKHSCSVLLARVDQFTEEEDATTIADQPPPRRRWRTWIDYDKFHQLAARHAHDETFTFQVSDYTAPTPSWALFGASEEGFDPTETRHRKKHKHPKYTQFDARGVPTHNDENQPLSMEERERLAALLKERQTEIGSAASVVTERRDGAKEIADASLMFRGMVIVK